MLHRIPFKCACGAEIHFHENLVVCVQGHVQGYWTLEEPQPIEADETKWKPRRPRGWKYEQGERIEFVRASTFVLGDQLFEQVIRDGEPQFAVWDNASKVFRYERDYWLGGDQKLVPYFGDLEQKGVTKFPSEIISYESEAELFEQISEFLKRYMCLEPSYERFVPYYVCFTWIYDRFPVLPYLHALGDYGRGKTRFLDAVGSICYKPTFTGGATTPAPVFRTLERHHGTLVIDEADFKISEDWQEILKILNFGFVPEYPVLRQEGMNRDRTRAYDVYSPKLLATRREFGDQALESRCITFNLNFVELREEVPLVLPRSFWKEALELRNRLLWFRFQHYFDAEPKYELVDRTVEPRLNQVLMPLYAMIRDERIRKELKEFVREYNRQIMAWRRESFEANVLQEIIRRREEGKVLFKDIAYTLEVRPQTVGRVIRKTLKLPFRHTMGGMAVVPDPKLLLNRAKYYGFEDEIGELKQVPLVKDDDDDVNDVYMGYNTTTTTTGTSLSSLSSSDSIQKSIDTTKNDINSSLPDQRSNVSSFNADDLKPKPKSPNQCSICGKEHIVAIFGLRRLCRACYNRGLR